MDVVAHLLPLVPENPVFAALEVAFDEIAEEAVKLHAGVIRARSGTRRGGSTSAVPK